MSRKPLPIVDTVTFDLENDAVATTSKAWCKYHQCWEHKELFYLESAKKAKHPGQVRNMCIEAWKIVYGKTDWTKLATCRGSRNNAPVATLSSVLY